MILAFLLAFGLMMTLFFLFMITESTSNTMFYVLLGISTLVGIIIAFVMKLYHKYGFFLIGLVVGIELGSVLWTIILERFLPDVIFTI